MRRRSVIPTLSLACCLLLCALWLRSYCRYDYVTYQRTYIGGMAVMSSRGRIEVASTRFDFLAHIPPDQTVPAGERWGWRAYDEDGDGVGEMPLWSAGFKWEPTRSGGWSVWLPLWMPVTLTLLPTAWRVWRRWKAGARGFEVEVA